MQVIMPIPCEGFQVVRPLTVFGYDDAPHGHAEVRALRDPPDLHAYVQMYTQDDGSRNMHVCYHSALVRTYVCTHARLSRKHTHTHTHTHIHRYFIYLFVYPCK